jgi:hypothetical protein
MRTACAPIDRFAAFKFNRDGGFRVKLPQPLREGRSIVPFDDGAVGEAATVAIVPAFAL